MILERTGVVLLFLAAPLVTGCDTGTISDAQDAASGVDAAGDPGHDAGTDPGADPGGDPGSDPGLDAGVDAGVDAGADPGGDEGPADCAAIATFEDGLVPERTLHVAENGNDNAGDGSLEHPFATIERAAQDASAGTAIRIHSGTYAGGAFISGLSGEPGRPVWLGGAPGEQRPVFEGGGQAMQLSRVRHLVVHDLEVRNTSQNGINCDDGSDYADPDATRHLILRNLWIHDVGSDGNQDCLKLSGLDDYLVLDSRFARCGGGMSGSGIDHVGCHHGLIARCRFEQMSGNGVQCKGGSEDIEIRWSRFVDAGERAVNMGGSTGFDYFRPPLSPDAANTEARDIRVVANLIEGGSASLAFVGCVDCLAAHNTIIDPERWILRILQETTTSDGYVFLPAGECNFTNNLVYFARDAISTWVNIGPGTAPETFGFQTNLWYAHDHPDQSQPALPVAEQGAVVGQDPQLRDPGGGDFHIGNSSPAAAAGAPLATVAGDLDGACFANPPSIGAYQASD